MGERPKIAVVDDPLAAGNGGSPPRARRPESRAPAPAKSPQGSANGSTLRPERRPPEQPGAPDLSAEPLTGVFGRVPSSLARRLEGMVFQLRAERKVSQQDVLAALLLRFVDHDDERSVAEMHRLLDGYERARDPRRSRATHSP